MPRRSAASHQDSLLDVHVNTAPCVPAIRKEIEKWRASKYKGVTDTTRLLLNHWFWSDHRSPGRPAFRYHHFQQEAIETLIYLYEVEGVRRHRDLLERFAPAQPDIRLLRYDDFARYAIKMATGSGKTKVMSLAVAWQYLNAIVEAKEDFAQTFLIIAPNVIVFERLRIDFEGGRIFRADPVIPPELRVYWDVDCYMRGDGEGPSSQGALYLTNVQQLYEDEEKESDEPEEMTAVLGAGAAHASRGWRGLHKESRGPWQALPGYQR